MKCNLSRPQFELDLRSFLSMIPLHSIHHTKMISVDLKVWDYARIGYFIQFELYIYIYIYIYIYKEGKEVGTCVMK